MKASWHTLRIGDRIRIICFPGDWNRPRYYVPSCTRRLYKRLIERRRSVRVYKIDDQGIPWINCKFRRKNGTWEYHYLAINDDIWIRVKRRI